MWTCLLLLCVQFVIGMTTGTQCPTGCHCLWIFNTTGLFVNCQGHSDVDAEQLSDQLDSLLSDNLTYGRLRWLTIYNSSLTHVPRSVCRLSTLTVLHLDHNRLTELPDNCLTNLSNLTRLTAIDNAIVTLQDGVFDGLRKLYGLDLSRNRISSIGLSVFASSSNLFNLFAIYLAENNLTSLEPWIYDRGLIGSFKQPIYIRLDHNKISKFTNEMGHTFPGHGLCNRGTFFVRVDFSGNKIQYIEDILNGWQLDLESMFRCTSLKNGSFNFFLNFARNNIACDCVNYNFFSKDQLRSLREVNCNLTDPITKKSRIVNGYNVDPSLFVCELTEHCPAGCICFRRPANAALHVYCSNKNLKVLPLELPELPDNHTYKLDFSNNRLLRRLEHRDYFVNTSVLDVSDSSVNDVSNWEEIAKIPDVNLFGNKITSLPRSFLSINITTRKLNLASNLWDCSCDNKWMSDCFSFIADRLKQKVQCYSPSRLRGKNIIEISDEEFCVDPASKAASKAVMRTLTISMSSAASVIVVLLFASIIIYRLRVKLYTRWKFHPFDRDECLGDDMEYDVFFCCSSMDHDPHALRIVQTIESKGYRVCYHERDFLPGQLITESISRAIESSKRTICLLSRNFLGR